MATRSSSGGPPLAFPLVVWVKARPRTLERAISGSLRKAVWVVQCVSELSRGRTRTQEHHTDVPISDWLNVLVYTAPGTFDVRCVYYDQTCIVHTGVVWRPVVLTDAEHHAPERGLINPAEWPHVRFEGVDYVV